MNYLLKGLSYSYNRNIGWQDRAIRTIVGFAAIAGAIYMYKQSSTVALLLGVLAVAQFGTVLSARCIMCYFAGKCTIGRRERNQLDLKGINYEK